MTETLKTVMEITGLPEVKAEKYFNQVKKDLAEDGEVTDEDVIEVIKIEKKVKDNGAKTVARAEPTTSVFTTKRKKLKSAMVARLQPMLINILVLTYPLMRR